MSFDAVVCVVAIDKITKEVLDFSNKAREKMKNNLLLIESKVMLIKGKNPMFAIYQEPVIKMRSMAIAISFFFFLIYYVFSWKGWLFVPLFMGIIILFQSELFVYFLLKKGLKKGGYRGKIQRLSNKEIIRRLL